MYKLSKQERILRERMRGDYPAEPKWYGMMVHGGCERPVRDRIVAAFSDRGVTEVLLPELVPSRKREERHRAPLPLLFSSYLFLRCRMTDEIYMTLSAYPEVVQILGRAYRIPQAIDDREIVHLKAVLVAHPRAHLTSRLCVGAEAQITRGLMEGMRGRVVEVNARYVKLETHFSFLDSDTAVLVSVPPWQVALEGVEGVLA